jgi:HAD superfamily hydrolase (TIGR01509 family)
MPDSWVIFDMDGTLIESERVWHDVRHDFVIENGGRWHEGAQQTMMGMRTNEWARYIREQLGVDLPPNVIAGEVVGRVCARFSESVPILPGAQKALARLADAFPLGLATSAAFAVAQAVLQKTGWDRFFRVVVSADQVARGKPAPDVYLRALELLGADARSAAAIEDSGNGIKSAHAAGLSVVAIPNREYPPPPDALALASRVIPRLDLLDASTVRDVIGAGVQSLTPQPPNSTELA